MWHHFLIFFECYLQAPLANLSVLQATYIFFSLYLQLLYIFLALCKYCFYFFKDACNFKLSFLLLCKHQIYLTIMLAIVKNHAAIIACMTFLIFLYMQLRVTSCLRLQVFSHYMTHTCNCLDMSEFIFKHLIIPRKKLAIRFFMAFRNTIYDTKSLI